MTQAELTKYQARLAEKEQELNEIATRNPKGQAWDKSDLRVAKILQQDIAEMSEIAANAETELRTSFQKNLGIKENNDPKELRALIDGASCKAPEGRKADYDFKKLMLHAGYLFLSQMGELDEKTKSDYEQKVKNYFGVTPQELKYQARALSESVNTAGSFLTPALLEAAIIEYRAEVGLARQHCQLINMGSDQVSFPKRYQGIQIAFQSENQLAASGQPSWNNVTYNAKTLVGFTQISNQLSEDSIIDLGAYLVREFGYSLGFVEDICLFQGTGTSPYPIMGLSATMASVASNKSIYTGIAGSKNTWNNITAQDFLKFVGSLTPYAGTKTGIYCSQQFYHQVLLGFTVNSGFGGNTLLDWQKGIGDTTTPTMVRGWMGYPVYTTTFALPFADNNQAYSIGGNVIYGASGAANVAYCGDMSAAVGFGSRANPVFASTNVGGNSFQANATLWRCIERFDIVPHSVGNIYLPDNVTTIGGPLIAYQTA